MPNPAEQLSSWFKKYEGIWLFIAAIGVFISPLISAKLTPQGVDNGISSIKSALLYIIPFRVYQLVLILIVCVIYFFRLRRRFRFQGIGQRILVGIWKNSWGPPNAGHETLRITPDLKYYVDDTLFFEVKNFKYDPITNIIEFVKAGMRPGDNRIVYNKLTLIDNDTLVGMEQDYPIKYERITSLK